jgi:hypothetical protein
MKHAPAYQLLKHLQKMSYTSTAWIYWLKVNFDPLLYSLYIVLTTISVISVAEKWLFAIDLAE